VSRRSIKLSRVQRQRVTVVRMDRLIVLDAGRFIARDAHDKLL
jgi:ABC-type transport system involved in Fe-S cluster assembly fused permease/ATPase subunit